MAGNIVRRFKPLLDRVLVLKAEAVSTSKGGILIPEKAQAKVREGTVIAAGPGAKNENGSLVPLSLAAGDKVLLPEFGGTKLELEDKEYTLFRESEILAKFAEE